MKASLTPSVLASAEFIRTIDPNECLQYFSWWAYVGIAVAYTGMVFKNEFAAQGTSIFAGGSRYSPFKAVGIHACFLVVVVGLIRAAGVLVFHLPTWMTNTFDTGRNTQIPVHTSVADLCLVFAVSILAFYEHRRLYQDSE